MHAKAAINWILQETAKALSPVAERFKSRVDKSRIVLLGHSMGGIVARLAAANIRYTYDGLEYREGKTGGKIRGEFIGESIDPRKIVALFTIGTPHRAPPFVVDRGLKELYNRLEEDTFPGAVDGNPRHFYPLISISGGERDTLIRDYLSILVDQRDGRNDVKPRPGFEERPHVHSAVTTGIANISVSIDHVCLCWCEELLKPIVEFLNVTAEIWNGSELAMGERELGVEPQRVMGDAKRLFGMDSSYGTMESGDSLAQGSTWRDRSSEDSVGVVMDRFCPSISVQASLRGLLDILDLTRNGLENDSDRMDKFLDLRREEAIQHQGGVVVRYDCGRYSSLLLLRVCFEQGSIAINQDGTEERLWPLSPSGHMTRRGSQICFSPRHIHPGYRRQEGRIRIPESGTFLFRMREGRKNMGREGKIELSVDIHGTLGR